MKLSVTKSHRTQSFHIDGTVFEKDLYLDPEEISIRVKRGIIDGIVEKIMEKIDPKLDKILNEVLRDM